METTTARLRGRIGALTLHSRGGTTTQAARAAFMARFDREVDPEGSLTPEERSRRASYARRLYFSRLALASAKARHRGVDE